MTFPAPMTRIYEKDGQTFVYREAYLRLLWEGKDRRDLIKVITGLRRCGKSTVLDQFSALLEEQGVPPERIVRIDLESRRFENLRRKEALYEYIDARKHGKPLYVMIDEVQMIDGWTEAVSGLYGDGDLDLYITGSNAFVLSSELATYLTGRRLDVMMLPLSFSEFLDIHPPDVSFNVRDRFSQHLMYGSIPMVDIGKSDDFNRILLGSLYSDIMEKDVESRLRATVDNHKLKAVALFLLDNIGNLSSVNGIATASGTDGKTVKTYIDAYIQAFLFHCVQRYDVVGKKLLNTTEKYYIADFAMRNAALGKMPGEDPDRALENIVYLELLRRGYTVRVGSFQGREVDFAAFRDGSEEYYQVTMTMMSDETIKREVRSLRDIRDSYPKTVLSLDDIRRNPGDGIRHLNIIDWLLGSG